MQWTFKKYYLVFGSFSSYTKSQLDALTAKTFAPVPAQDPLSYTVLTIFPLNLFLISLSFISGLPSEAWAAAASITIALSSAACLQRLCFANASLIHSHTSICANLTPVTNQRWSRVWGRIRVLRRCAKRTRERRREKERWTDSEENKETECKEEEQQSFQKTVIP